jgi:hypothetical protein
MEAQLLHKKEVGGSVSHIGNLNFRGSITIKPLKMKLSEPQSSSVHCGEERSLLSLPELNPNFHYIALHCVVLHSTDTETVKMTVGCGICHIKNTKNIRTRLFKDIRVIL